MNKATEVTARLKALGFDQAKIDETMAIFYKDIQEDMLLDLVEKSSEEEVEEYVNRVKAAKSAEHLLTVIQEMAMKVYGENAETELDNKLLVKVEELEQLTKNIKENFDKYQAGDPETVKAVEEAMKTPEAKDIAEAISEES